MDTPKSGLEAGPCAILGLSWNTFSILLGHVSPLYSRSPSNVDRNSLSMWVFLLFQSLGDKSSMDLKIECISFLSFLNGYLRTGTNIKFTTQLVASLFLEAYRKLQGKQRN